MTQYYTYRRVIIRCTLLLCKVSQIHIHLTYILMPYCIFLKVYQDKTFQYPMIEDQIKYTGFSQVDLKIPKYTYLLLYLQAAE